MGRRVRELGILAAGGLLVAAGLVAVGREAAADEPAPPSARDAGVGAAAQDPGLRARLERGERLVWPGPAHRPTLVLKLEGKVLLLERGLRDLDPEVAVRREGAFLVVDGPATLRLETEKVGARRLDATTLLGLPWGAPAPSTEAASVGDSRLQMIEGDASIARPAAPAEVAVARGQQAPLEEKDDAKLGEFAEGKVEVGGSQLTLLEHTSLRVLSIGETSSVVEVLGVRLEMQRGTVIEAAFGSLVLNLRRGAALVSPGSAGADVPLVRLTHEDPGTGIIVTTSVKLQPGQQLGVSPTGAWTTPDSASPVTIEVTLSVPVYDDAGNVVGRTTVTSYQGTTPVGTGPTIPALVEAIAQVMASARPDEVGPLMDAVSRGESVTDLGLVTLVTQYTGDPAVAGLLDRVVGSLGTEGGGGEGFEYEPGAPPTTTEGDTTVEVEVFFNGSTSSVPGDDLGGAGSFANGTEQTPESIETERSQNSTGSTTGSSGNTGTTSPASTAAFLR